jgi:hypothetical protein
MKSIIKIIQIAMIRTVLIRQNLLILSRTKFSNRFPVLKISLILLEYLLKKILIDKFSH